MNKQSNFRKVPLYAAVVYSIASISLVVYLSQHDDLNNQYVQAAYSTPTPYGGIPSPNCLGTDCGVRVSTPTQAMMDASVRDQGVDPCEVTSASGQDYSVYSQTNNDKQSNNDKKSDKSKDDNFFDRVLKFLTDLINFLLQLIGRSSTQTPNSSVPNPGVVVKYPSPSVVSAPISGVMNNPTTKLCPTAIPVPTKKMTAPTAVPSRAAVVGDRGSVSLDDASVRSKTRSVKVTFYGSYDNDPKGSLAIAHPVIHKQAGGKGTYDDPLTFASPEGAGAYSWGTKIYVPSVQKYFIREDICGVSWTAEQGCGAVTMVDLYVGNPSSSQAVVECENSLTSGNKQIVVDPPAGLPYDSTPIWDQSTGKCMKLHQ